MKKLSLRNESEVIGKVLGKPIYDADGRLLLAEGIVLTPSHVKHLKNNNFSSVYVTGSDEAQIRTPVSDLTAMKTTKTVKEISKALESKKPVDNLYEMFRENVEEIVEEILQNKNVITNLDSIKNMNDYTYQHSANMTTIALYLSKNLDFSKQQLIELGMGCLLHDIGKQKIPKEILNKKEKLTDSEWEIIKKHPKNGYDIIRNSGKFSFLTAHVAYQHHERYDGNGYPRGMKGNGYFATKRADWTKIHPYADVAIVADAMDAMLSDRPYRPGKSIDEVLNELKANSSKQFNPVLVDLVTKMVPRYPPGTSVIFVSPDMLGYRGVVIDVDKKDVNKYTIKLTHDENQKEIDKPIIVEGMIAQIQKSEEIKKHVDLRHVSEGELINQILNNPEVREKLKRSLEVTAMENRSIYNEIVPSAQPDDELLSKREFEILLDHQISIAERYNNTFSVMFVDMDNLKTVNDTYGHLVGDQFIQKFINLLKDKTRNADKFVARYKSGDEFMLLLPHTDKIGAYKLAERLLQEANKTTISIEDKELQLSASIGIVEYKKGKSLDKNSLLSYADNAMYQAKKSGKNKIYILDI
jgi:diguanylate cyclase (GGDEF)-like protein